jgi:ribosome-binding protein aMBF1 (putative translation factor)
MKALTDHQIIKKNGVPLFVVVPYEEYMRMERTTRQEGKVYIPHEVAEKHLLESKSLSRCWREHKGLSQKAVAMRMGISQSSYAQMERTDARLRKATRQRIATALGIDADQLEI